MNKTVLLIFLLGAFFTLNAQVSPQRSSIASDTLGVNKLQDTIRKPKETLIDKAFKKLDSQTDQDKKAKIQDYLIISHKNDTTYVDTTLTIQKEYKYNYLRRDNFGLISFSNLGQSYNSLTYNFQNTKLMPSFGATARHFNYMEVEDISYYNVPTPLTELFYKTAFEQGQLADSFFTVNTSPQFNFSVAYKGLRSLGEYQHILTSTGNFRFTTSYKTKNNRYQMRGHIVMQDLLNQENGGIQDDNIPFFEEGVDEYLKRAVFEVNFENAESILKGKRFHLEQNYKLVEKDSTSSHQISLGHIISFEDKYFEYSQSTANTTFFGDAFSSSTTRDRVTLGNLRNQVHLNYSNKLLGELQLNVSNSFYNYGYNKVVKLTGSTIANRLRGSVNSIGGTYKKQLKNFLLEGELGINATGDFAGNYIKGKASFKLNDDISAEALINHSSRTPNYNTLLYQSNYQSYNWENNLNNTDTQQIAFKLKSNKIATITVDYTTLTDYVYFKQGDNTTAIQEIKAFQNNKTISYLRVKLENEIRFKKLALNSTILYQNVQDDNNVLNVPELTTRNTLYYSTHLFKKAMYLQTGVTLNYFTEYFMNAYNPLLAEFYVQTDQKYGAFPRLDFFINAKIRQTRIYVKAEHFNSAFTGYNYYSAPNHPYRDFTVRFGVVWNFFL